jgi:hypothetical protein
MSDLKISPRKAKLMQFQFAWTIFIAITCGFNAMFMPKLFMRTMNMKKEQDRAILGLVGAVYMAFGLTSILGLRNPRRFANVLWMQFLYKAIWLSCVILPMARRKELDEYWFMAVGYIIAFIVPDLICVPFKELLLEERT